MRKKENILPEECPAVVVRFSQLCVGGRSASVCRAGSIRSAVAAVILVVRDEHSEGLRAGNTSVVRALGGLDGGRDFGS